MRLHTVEDTEYKLATNVFKTSTDPRTPQHNPFRKQIIQAIFESARTILKKGGLERKNCSYAVENVTYIKNRLLHLALACTSFMKLAGKRSFFFVTFAFLDGQPSFTSQSHRLSSIQKLHMVITF